MEKSDFFTNITTFLNNLNNNYGNTLNTIDVENLTELLDNMRNRLEILGAKLFKLHNTSYREEELKYFVSSFKILVDVFNIEHYSDFRKILPRNRKPKIMFFKDSVKNYIYEMKRDLRIKQKLYKNLNNENQELYDYLDILFKKNKELLVLVINVKQILSKSAEDEKELMTLEKNIQINLDNIEEILKEM